MPLTVVCHSCDARLKVGDHLAGKKAKCPKCGAILTVPTDNEPEEDQIAPAASRPGRKAPPVDEEDERPVRRPRRDDDEEDEDDRPARRSRRRDDEEDEEDDDRPARRRRRDDEEDEDDRPTRRKKKKKKGGSTKWILIILGVVGGLCLLCCGGGGFWFYHTLDRANPNVNRQTFSTLGSARSLSEVTVALGPSKVATPSDLSEAFQFANGPFGNPQGTLTRAGATTYRWRNGEEWIFAVVKDDTQQVLQLTYVASHPTQGGGSFQSQSIFPNPGLR